MKKQKRQQNSRGATQVEFACVLIFGIPLLALLIFTCLECARFYTIKSAMEVGARSAARALVVNYNRTGNKNGSNQLTVTMPHYISNPSQQFVVNWDTANNPPKSVTVTCQYYPNGGNTSLPEFPAGPLKYFGTTFSLGTIVVKGTYTWPIQ